MFSRRHFHRRLACLVGGSLGSPRFVFATDAEVNHASGRRIVTVFLDGGNDGLNTVIPAKDPLYHHYRRNLRIKAEDASSLDGQMFLHPSLRDLTEIWNSGRMRIQQGVGYPNHSRSHFESAAVWSEGRLDAESPSFDGWLARTLDPLQQSVKAPLACAIESTETPELLRGRSTRTTTLPNLPGEQAARLAKRLRPDASKRLGGDLQQMVADACRDAANTLQRHSEARRKRFKFPATAIGQRLGKVATVLDSMPEVKAIHVEQSGYDTHSAQRDRHASLLSELGEGLRALDRFLMQSGHSESTLVMVFSEFGRRVQENASAGTDHGAAAPVLLLGGTVPPGLYGSRPDLEQLDRGDVAVTQDLREIQNGIARWLRSGDAKLFLPV